MGLRYWWSCHAVMCEHEEARNKNVESRPAVAAPWRNYTTWIFHDVLHVWLSLAEEVFLISQQASFMSYKSSVIFISVLCVYININICKTENYTCIICCWVFCHWLWFSYGFQVERTPKKHMVEEFEEFDYSDLYDDISVSTVDASTNVTEYEVRLMRKSSSISLALCLCVCVCISCFYLCMFVADCRVWRLWQHYRFLPCEWVWIWGRVWWALWTGWERTGVLSKRTGTIQTITCQEYIQFYMKRISSVPLIQLH